VAAGKKDGFYVSHYPPVKPRLDLGKLPPHFIDFLVVSGAILLAWLKKCHALGFKKGLNIFFGQPNTYNDVRIDESKKTYLLISHDHSLVALDSSKGLSEVLPASFQFP
jgi:hypothetical protein